jgi:adenine phosphoribosyltransferase
MKELQPSKAEDLKSLIRDLPDYPVKGVIFRDLTPLFKDQAAFRWAISRLASKYGGGKVDVVAAVEARGFIVGAPLAMELRVGFVPLRKPGKLPWKKEKVTYQLEYGQESIEIHEDAIKRGQRVLLVDDLLATGGTASAAAKLIERLGGKVVGMAFVVELAYLQGRKKLEGYDVGSLLVYR